MTRLYTFALVLFLRLTATPRRLISVSVTAFSVVVLCIASSTYGAIADASTGVVDGLTPVAAPAGMPAGAAEQPALRTANSQTFALPGGINEAVISQTPVNYQDSQGRWQPIDTSLVSGSSGYTNAANSFSLTVPANGKNPVQLAEGSASIGISVDGASGTTSADGSTATVANALPGLSIRYTSLSNGVADDLVASSLAALTTPLAGPAAGAQSLGPSDGPQATTIGFHVSLAAGMTLQAEDDGSVDALDASGASKFVISPVVMEDAAGIMSPVQNYSITPNADGSWELSLTPDLAWLSKAGRAWPVTIDPNLVVNDSSSASSACSIASGHSSSNYCAASTQSLGNDSSGNWRTVLAFSLAGVPAHANVMNASLTLTVTAHTTGSTMTYGAYPLSRDYTTGVTWSTYDGTNSWGTAGGDFTLAVDNSSTYTPGDASLTPTLTRIVQGWMVDPTSEHGVVLKPTSEPASNLVTFDGVSCGCGNAPTIDVTYLATTGFERQFSYASYDLTDRTGLSVNLATGDLTLKSDDLNLAGVGMPLNIVRYYDSAATIGSGLAGTYGGLTDGWRMSVGEDVAVYEEGEDATVVTPNGDVQIFDEQTSHSYTSPAGIDAKLTYDSPSNTYKLSYHQSGTSITFTYYASMYAYLATTVKDRNGNTITYNYGSSGNTYSPVAITSISDTLGQTTSFSYNSSQAH